ncbi:hypothetical protein GBAR_LOCUS20337, partial [Geodia barretti]
LQVTSVPAQRLSDPHDAPRIVRERQTFELFVAAVDGTMKGICDGTGECSEKSSGVTL